MMFIFKAFFILLSISLFIGCTSDIEVKLLDSDSQISPTVENTAPIAVDLDSLSAPENNEQIVTLHYTDEENDQAQSCQILIPDGTPLTLTTPCTCSSGTCTAGVTGEYGYFGDVTVAYNVTANGKTSNVATINLTINEVTINCPTGFVPADGNLALGTRDFCLMQFEAKCDGSGACNSTDMTSLPLSQAAGTPWVNIRANESAGAGSGAQARCEAMGESGFPGNFSLISNPEWMTIARDIESVDTNWAGGSVGSGDLARGWSARTGEDGFQNTVAAPVSDSSCLYNSAADTCSSTGIHTLRRIHQLSNGTEVWDFAGNVWEWVDWYGSDTGYSAAPTGCVDGGASDGWNEFNEIITGCSDGSGVDDFYPLGGYTSAQSAGRWFGGTAQAAIRGGRWNDGSTWAGVFAIMLAQNATTTWDSIGFRCVYRPQQPPIARDFNSENINENTEKIITLDYYDLNGDDATDCSISNETNLLETTPCSCLAGTCTVGITGINNYTGPGNFNFTVIDDDGISNSARVNLNISTCPTGFINVLGNSSLGTNDFCVMQFEAKCSSADGLGCNTSTEIPISQPENLPWRDNVTSSVAYNACARMSEAGYPGEFRLIATPEWMTIARDIELVETNWSGGDIGLGHIPRGHSDDDGTGPLEVTDLSDYYNGTGNNSGEAAGSGWEQKRIHYLSTNQIIWDFAGNTWEWTDWTAGDGMATQGPTDGSAGWDEPSDISGSILPDELQSIGGYGSAQSFGQWWGSTQGGPIRGGAYNRNAISGILAINFDANMSTGYATTSFRCVYIP